LGRYDKNMKAQEASELGLNVAALVRRGQMDKAYALLSPVLAARTTFRLLEKIGEPIGDAPPYRLNSFLNRVAEERTEGGWVVIDDWQIPHVPFPSATRPCDG
jgi:hypothetical protein